MALVPETGWAAADLSTRAPLFAYDVQSPLAVQVLSVGTATSGVVRHEISFVGDPKGAAPTAVAATLLLPTAESRRKFAGILWVHWLGEPATTNRSQFLVEAEALAPRGVVSLLVETMWARPHWYRERVLEKDFSMYVRQVVELRRALDLLAARPEVDPGRIALVAHDYGAMHGLIAAALDARVKTSVLIAAAPSFNDWAFYVERPADMEAYLRELAPLELVDYAPALAGRPVFLQFAREDFYVPLPRAEALYSAFGEPRRMQVYDGAGHAMTAPPAIREDRTAWLVRELGLPAD
jgi:pimeloyl-ACP methyl ester carboxylesterase